MVPYHQVRGNRLHKLPSLAFNFLLKYLLLGKLQAELRLYQRGLRPQLSSHWVHTSLWDGMELSFRAGSPL